MDNIQKIPNVTHGELEAMLSTVSLEKDELVLKAIKQVEKSHKNQTRDDGSSYLEQHVYAVASSVIEHQKTIGGEVTPELVAGALLHDVLEEDRTLTDKSFKQKFGDRVYSIVKPLTKDYSKYPGKTNKEKKAALDKDYFKSLESAPVESKIIKLADRLNNLVCSRLEWCGAEKISSYIKETQSFYLQFAKKVSQFYHKQINIELERIKNTLK